MLTFVSLCCTLALCEVVDFKFTTSRIRMFGLDAELNTLIKFCVKRFGRNKGIGLALFAPMVITGAVCGLMGKVPLALLVGAKLKSAYDQFLSSELQKKALQARSQHEAGSSPSLPPRA